MRFCTLVLIPGAADVEENVSILMGRFEEDVEVAPYEEFCDCVHERAKVTAFGDTERKFGTIETLTKSYDKSCRKKVRAKRKSGPTNPDGQSWSSFITPFVEYHLDRTREVLHSVGADPDCPECLGNGKQTYTENPCGRVSHWWLASDELTEGPVDWRLMGQGSRPMPIAVITPDGSWHQTHHMGWVAGFLEFDLEGWRELVDHLIERNSDCMPILVNCRV
jgi:hypothetical protein